MSFVDFMMKKGLLVSPNLVVKRDINEEIISKIISLKNKPFVINKDIYESFKNINTYEDINWKEFDKSRIYYEKNRSNEDYLSFLSVINYESESKLNNIFKYNHKQQDVIFEEDPLEPTFIVVKEYKENIKKKEVRDFVQHFRVRYNLLKNLLLNRPELKECISINRVLNKNNNEKVSIIGLIVDKRTTKNGNIILEIEDLTGKINCIVGKNKKELFALTQDLVFDQCIGLIGVSTESVIFVNDILLPDIPINNKLKVLGNENYIVFTSDLHVGSKMFLENDFLNFIKWLNCDYGDEEQRKIASKVKFLFLAGDLVEGVGIYPRQENDLLIKDIKKQYDKLSEYLGILRKEIHIVAIGGNHDSLRLAEPQPKLHPIYAEALYNLDNLTVLTNPSMVNIFSSRDFDGFNILLYHGSSFPYIADTVDSIRISGRLDRVDLIMKHSLQARHLAPTHNSVQYIPDNEEDPLIIDRIPDFYVSGHIHKVVALNYRGVTLVGSGCWTEQTEDQEKRGIVPDPSKIIVINLENREVKVFNFRNG